LGGNISTRLDEKLENFLGKRFVAWDGEGSEVPNGTPQPYMLFGNSDGLSIQAEQLSTIDCLDLITRGIVAPQVVNFAFAFNYDVNQILRNLGSTRMDRLMRKSRVKFKDYLIEWVPSKWLQVKRDGKFTKAVKIYDVWHFFNCALVTNDPKNPGALDKFDIGTPAEREYLARMKAERPQFRWEEIDEVKHYWRLEGQLMVALMERVRDIFGQAGFYIKTWHGPGALARYMLNAHKIKQIDYRETNRSVWEAACYAFSAGRFEQFRAGLHKGNVWNYDIHSAYPYAIQFLPNLHTGKWRHTRNVDRNAIDHRRFALYQINYNGKGNSWAPRPLFRRLQNDNICWPSRVNGWYWSPEAELVKNDPNAEFAEAWEFDDDGTRPMAWIGEIYERRERLKSQGNPMEYPLKLGMNSCYGQFAQRAGWENQRVPGPPRLHQLEWAGYITSMCKAMVYTVAKWCWGKGSLVTIDTDGVFTTTRIPENVLPNGIGDGLGQWEEKRHDGILVWQSGFYWLKDDDSWSKCRSRGAPRGTVPFDLAMDGMERVEKHEYPVNIEYEKKVFMGYGAAKQLGMFWKWRSWSARPIELIFGGRGKRQHDIRSCPRCSYEKLGIKRPGWDQQLHILRPAPPHPNRDFWEKTFYEQKGDDFWSMKHRLPWEEKKEEVDDIIFDEDELVDEDVFEDVTL
jgi:hypothetical protein